jgi:hypothetical protein
MDTPISIENVSTSSKVLLTSQEQWENFTAHHCGQWRGILLRYDGAGNVLDILDSVRSFTPAEDRLTVTHALDFRSRMTGEVSQKQWVLTPGNPLITHPLDPNAYLLFNRNSSDIMVGYDRTSPKAFYFEPYLLVEGKRTSIVVMYSGENSPQPSRFSFFREVREGLVEPWWSGETICTIVPVAELILPANSSMETYVSLNELSYMSVPSQPFEVPGDFLHFRFPDAVNLVVSSNRFVTPYYTSMWWIPEPNEVPRICSLIYRQPNQNAEVLAV